MNPYIFCDVLSDKVNNDAIIIPDAGQNVIVPGQSFKIKLGQRFLSSWANSPMGYSFPASIGAQFGSPKKQVVCIIGDGGIQLNIQDLQTVKHYKLPIKIFIINNRVYGAILEFQDPELGNRYEATDEEHGYTHPNFEAVSNAYGIKYLKINSNQDLIKIDDVLDEKEAIICEVLVDPKFRIEFPEHKPDVQSLDSRFIFKSSN